MAWEPWFQAVEPVREDREYDPNDPSLLVNILTKDMTEEDHRRAREMIENLDPEPVDNGSEDL